MTTFTERTLKLLNSQHVLRLAAAVSYCRPTFALHSNVAGLSTLHKPWEPPWT